MFPKGEKRAGGYAVGAACGYPRPVTHGKEAIMTTLILIALILLLVCTAAGLVFLAVTISDRADENIIKNADTADDDEFSGIGAALGRSRMFAPAGRAGKSVGRFSKKSDVELWGTKTRIVSATLKRDFEKTLAQMKQNSANEAQAQAAAEAEPADAADYTEAEAVNAEFIEDADDTDYTDTEELFYDEASETEFIDVFELVNEGGLKNKTDEDFLDEDEFLLGEEILR